MKSKIILSRKIRNSLDLKFSNENPYFFENFSPLEQKEQ